MAAIRIMGIVNVTPDSFSDGGRFLDPDAAIEHGLQLAAEGASLLDVGGESTRPGAEPVSEREELRRVVPVVEGLAQALPDVEISIDTSKAAVAAAAIEKGARLVNDVTALRGDPHIAGVVGEAGVECCLMHTRGTPKTMRDEAVYDDVVEEVSAFLRERIAFATAAGIEESRLLLDPGIGFAKTPDQDLQLLRRLQEIVAIGRPVVIGTSRKSFLGRILADAAGADRPAPIPRRLPGTIATNVLAFERGASVFRVHDVAPLRDALTVAAATLGRPWTSAKTTT